jgi:hypothetical protein
MRYTSFGVAVGSGEIARRQGHALSGQKSGTALDVGGALLRVGKALLGVVEDYLGRAEAACIRNAG